MFYHRDTKFTNDWHSTILAIKKRTSTIKQKKGMRM